MKKHTKALGALLMAGCAVLQSQADTIDVSGVQQYVGGTETSVPGSGTAANYDSGTAVGDYAVFDMTKNGSDYADLKVTYLNDGAGIGSNMMIARTTDSQGLVDTGTISVLLDANSSGGATLKFDWYTPGSFSDGVFQSGSLLSDKVLFTTFDIDYKQYVGVPLNQIEYVAFNAADSLEGTDLTADLDTKPGWVLAEDATANGINASYTDVNAAAQFMMTGESLEMEMGKLSGNGPSLFMFEFRDPSTILPSFDSEVVPEPTAIAMIGFAGLTALWVRRRFLG
jgi:hypothetical protein